MTIWKFPFSTQRNVVIEMPENADILCVDTQGNTPCIWAEVDSDRDTEERHFNVYGTGHELDLSNDMKYIGTYQQKNGSFIWHLYEVFDLA